MDIKKEFLVRILFSQFRQTNSTDVKEVDEIVNYLFYIYSVLQERGYVPNTTEEEKISKRYIKKLMLKEFNCSSDDEQKHSIKGEYYDNGLSMNDTIEKIKIDIKREFIDEIIAGL